MGRRWTAWCVPPMRGGSKRRWRAWHRVRHPPERTASLNPTRLDTRTRPGARSTGIPPGILGTMPSKHLSIEARLPEVGTTIFTVMSALAQEHGAINLSQGFPDFDAPAELLLLLDKHTRAGHNQYPPMAGVPVLRGAIAAQVHA